MAVKRQTGSSTRIVCFYIRCYCASLKIFYSYAFTTAHIGLVECVRCVENRCIKRKADDILKPKKDDITIVMKKLLESGEETLPYTLKVYRSSRCVRFIVHRDGSLVVTCPRYVRFKEVEQMLMDRLPWIREKIRRSNPSSEKPLRGVRYERSRQMAKELVVRLIRDIDPSGRFSYTGISIGRPKTRWGSCSSRGTLNFHYRILELPEPLARYIVAHELCHLEEMNHSVRFWSKVAELIPDWRFRRSDLRHHDRNRDDNV